MAEFITDIEIVHLNYTRPVESKCPRISHLSYISEELKKALSKAQLNTLDISECYWIFLLDETNRLLGIGSVSHGAINDLKIFCREVLQLGLTANAQRIMIVRNSPKNDMTATDLDKEIIKKVRRVIKLVNIEWSGYILIAPSRPEVQIR